MMLQEFLKDYKDSPFAHAIVSGTIAFIVTFTLDMFFTNLYTLIYRRRTKPVPPPEKITQISMKKVPNYKRYSNRSSKKVTYDDGNRGKKYSHYTKEIYLG
jgi:hypothetical protein